MKKSVFLWVILILSNIYAQAQISFERVLPPSPAPQIAPVFRGVQFSSIAFSDIDGDRDSDVLITGLSPLNQPIAKLYSNDSTGNYTLQAGTPFDGVDSSSVAFSDVDGDGDSDVLITGSNTSNQPVSILYTNNGAGNFTLVSGTPFDGVQNGSVAFSDIDGDSDMDVLITGSTSSNMAIAKIYTNDGSGNYSLLTGTPFDGVRNSSIAFSDIDGDSDSDVLITGENSSNQRIAKLYTNDGSGSFTLVNGTPFDGVSQSSIAFSDIDGDNDYDVLITGGNASNQAIAKLYTNDGSGNFTLSMGVPFNGVKDGSVAFSDVDGDSDIDVLITGDNGSLNGLGTTQLYTNDGSGNYSLVTGTSFDGVDGSSVAFSDINRDGDLDVLITGWNYSHQRIAKIYTNDGTGNFTLVTGTPFHRVTRSSIAFSDIDGDGDSDVLISGRNSTRQRTTMLYTNDGSGNYSLVNGAPFSGIEDGSIAFSDIDGDGDFDVLITGRDSSNQAIAELYTNDGTGKYTLVTGTPFDGVTSGSIAFSDIDGDNDSDILITGGNGSGQLIAKLYTNDGSGNYTLVTGTSFDGVITSSIAFSDIDGDNDEDVLITGRNGSGKSIANLYTNDGSGNFSQVNGTSFVGVHGGSIAFSDIDGDNDEDVLITGKPSIFRQSAKLYTNDGIGNYTLVKGTPFDSVQASAVAFSDIDRDSDSDVLITGWSSTGYHTANLYRNDSSGSYTLVTGTPFERVSGGSIAFSDIDGDGDADVLITGRNSSFQTISSLFRNTSCSLLTSADTIASCGNYTWSINGQTYAMSGTYIDTLTSVSGCDSTVTLYLTIKHSNTGSDTITSCDNYTWPTSGLTYNSSGVYFDTLTNIRGCDSIVNLNLTIKNSNSSSETKTSCDSYLWSSNGETYTNSGIYKDTLTNVNGCDSIVTLNLSINYRDSSVISISSCDSYSWPQNGKTYIETGEYRDTISTTIGCDSVIILDLVIDTANTQVLSMPPLLTAQASSSRYQWIDCSNDMAILGETKQSYTATANGDYKVEITQNGCVDTSDCYNVSNVGLGNSSEQYETIQLFPNPTNGEVTIAFDKAVEHATIVVYSATGQEVLRKEIENSNQTTTTLTGDAGIYHVVVVSESGEQQHFRVVKR